MPFGLAMERDIEQLKASIEELKTERKPLEISAYERLADLEVKMSKLWALLVEERQPGRPKLSKFGRLFGGKAKQLSQ